MSIHVVAAIMIYQGLFFCAQRKSHNDIDISLKWEFPGGKIEQGESHLQALTRELDEELGINIESADFFGSFMHHYRNFDLNMEVYTARINKLPIVLNSHIAYKLLPLEELDQLDWAEADRPVVEALKNKYSPALMFSSNRSTVRFIDQLRDLLHTPTYTQFDFSVSFIKIAGLNEIYDSLVTFLNNPAHTGRLLTTTYQFFTDPESLIKLYKLSQSHPNFSVRIDMGGNEHRGFHTKGYIFRNDNQSAYLIGSTNLTKQALTMNEEWNLLVTRDNDSQLPGILHEFTYLWNQSKEVDLALIENYQKYYKSNMVRDYHQEFISTLQPLTQNAMQKEALMQLELTRSRGGKRALVVSATGSGKTYLAAFDVQQVSNPKVRKVLFVVHRDKIRFDALYTFRQVFHDDYTYGFFDGKKKDLDVDFLFASNIALSQHLSLFDPTLFDYVVIDEAHHAGADTIRRIIDHFNPRFLLGLTATPHRMDGTDVFQLFDNNLPYVLSLREAIRDNLIVPFHYYGIKDEANYDVKDIQYQFDHTEIMSRAQNLDSNIKKHIIVTDKLRAIGFCRTIKEADDMCLAMQQHGYHCTSMTVDTPFIVRKAAFDSIESDRVDSLNIIFTVDLLNEGVDIPSINAVFFLRPTDSHVVFTQQLGRGLRKYPGKEYLTVLDFIGNHYERVEQLAVALTSMVTTGDQTNRKMINIIRDDFRNLDIPISIHLDQLSKDTILAKLEKTVDITKKRILSEYNSFKAFLAREKYGGQVQIPLHTDYCDTEYAPDLMKIIAKYGSYHDFLTLVENEYSIQYTANELNIIRSLSALLPITQNLVFNTLLQLINHGPLSEHDILTKLQQEEQSISINDLDYALKVLAGEIDGTWIGNKKPLPALIHRKDDIAFIGGSSSFVLHLKDMIAYGLFFWRRNYGSNQLVNHRSYRQQDIYMSLKLPKLITFMRGEWWMKDKNLTILYITLQKDENSDILYKDAFIDRWTMKWESMGGKTIRHINDYRNRQNVNIFVRKKDSTSYYYLGLADFSNLSLGHAFDPKTKTSKDVIVTHLELRVPVDNDLYYELSS